MGCWTSFVEDPDDIEEEGGVFAALEPWWLVRVHTPAPGTEFDVLRL